MHILGLILVGLTTAAVWYMRLKALGGAARDVHKIAKRVQNAPRKFAFMHRAGRSGLRAVDDPREASTILMVLMAGGYGEKPMEPEYQHVMQVEAAKVFELEPHEAEDLITHAVWMTREVELVSGVVLRMTQMIKQTPGIGPTELVDLYEMLDAVGQAAGPPNAEQAHILDLYRNKVGLTV